MVLNLISLDKIIYQGEVYSITLPGADGQLTILPHHIPLITPLKKGKIKIKDIAEKEIFFEIEGGILEVKPEEVNILVS